MEESARSQPRAVAQVGAKNPFPRFRGAQFTTENRKVAWRTQRHHGSHIMPNSQCFLTITCASIILLFSILDN